MRAQILDALLERMGSNHNIFFATADMGINLVEKIQESYPDRYLNVGIAEQNLIGVCSGLVNLGYRPFAYTISNFLVARCIEQIRNDIAVHQYPVTLLGMGTGFDNAALAPTHHILDDWGMMKGLAGFEIFCPSSVPYAMKLLDRVLAGNQPVYIRIPKTSYQEPNTDQDYAFLPGNQPTVLLISYGAPAQECLELQKTNPAISTLVCNKLHPLDEEPLASALRKHPQVIVVEDHFANTGLFSSLCQFVMERGLNCKLHSLAPDKYNMTVGTSSSFYYALYGMDAAGIARKIAELGL